MARVVRVNLAERGYDVRIGRNLPVGVCLGGGPGARVLLVSDSNVDPLHGARCAESLRACGAAAVHRVVVPAGEASKSLERAGRLFSEAVRAGLDRGAAVAALGGGMVGDLAGFVAATYLRGVRLIQAPTTLLAMVDSSVGGKTAVNLPEGKNLVGVFHQPAEVAADLDTLATLPEREYASGLAEVVKYGVIRDAALFREIEAGASGLAEREPEALERIVARCCEIKAEVVAMDERESGIRAILNFGHTLGHALENTLGYGALLHGEAVAVGMVYAARLSVAARGLAEADCRRIERLLARFGLPVSPAAGAGGAPGWDAVRAAMAADKKSRQAAPRLVLAEKIGAAAFGCRVDEALMREEFARLMR